MFGRTQSTLCGCWYLDVNNNSYYRNKAYLPLVDLASKTTILVTTSRTHLTQTFKNPKSEKLAEVQYTFPLYDGVTVVSFKCVVGGRTIIGVVKEKQQARTDYDKAIQRGETAGLLEQIPEASDAFTTKIGNIPANEKVVVEIEYLGELKHDAETDGSRFTIPTTIAPRYGSVSFNTEQTINNTPNVAGGRIEILVDIAIEESSTIRGVQSPSHPIALTMGRMSSTIDEDAFNNNHASATLTLGSSELDKDFVIVVLAKGQDVPRALLETHPTLPNHRALMATLVPKFNLPAIHPEIVFVVDRSGSMNGKMDMLISAMRVFLKSIPIGVKFNICSFGSRFDFMFKKSQTYDQASLSEALARISNFDANYGGTEMFPPIEATVKNRFKDLPLEIILLTDGEIWNQQELFDFINKACKQDLVRVFSLGIGSGVSSSLVEGVARAGDGFAQFVDDHERMDKRVVRMLKGALTPHIKDYKLEVKYENTPTEAGDDFEMIESVEAVLQHVVVESKPSPPSKGKKWISLFDTSTKEEPTNSPAGKYDHLPTIATPLILQAPHKVPSLYPFNRTTVYLLLGPASYQKIPKSVILRGTSEHGPLELEIPVQDIGLGQTIHQLAAKKAVHELEQGRGWLIDAKTNNNQLIKSQHEGRWDEIVEREAVRLGVQFQVGGKWCSFVAVEKNTDTVVASSERELPEKKLSSVSEGRSAGGGGFSSGYGASFQSSVRAFGATPAVYSGDPLLGGAPGCGPARSRKIVDHAAPQSKSQLAAPFSSNPPSAGLVGNSCPSAAAVSSGGLFGSSSSGGGLFGSSAGGIFGNSTTRDQVPASGFCGNSSAITGPARASGLFGGSRSGGGLFGSSTAGRDPASIGGFFGNSNVEGTAHVSSLFGNSTAGSVPARATDLFGSTPNSGAVSKPSLFGGFASTGFGNPAGSAGPARSAGLFSDSTSPQNNAGGGSIFGGFAQQQQKNGFGGNPNLIRTFSPSQRLAASPLAPSDCFTPVVSNTANADFDDLTVTTRTRRLNYMNAMNDMSLATPPAHAPAIPAYCVHGRMGSPTQGDGKLVYRACKSAPLSYSGVSRRMAVQDGEAEMAKDEEFGFDNAEGNADVAEAASVKESRKKLSKAGKQVPMSKEEQLHRLINLQNFDGSWEWTLDLQCILNLTSTKVYELFAGKEKALQRMLQATVSAIAFLEINMADEEETWEMVAEKAKKWLAGYVGAGGADKEIEVAKVSFRENSKAIA